MEIMAEREMLATQYLSHSIYEEQNTPKNKLQSINII